MLKRLLVKLGFRKWVVIDNDGPFQLLKCAWSGERRTVIPAKRLRRLTPRMRPRWEKA